MNIISLIWGIICYTYDYALIEHVGELMNMFLVISMATVLWSLIMAIITTVIIFVIGLFIRAKDPEEAFRWFPVIYLLLMYIGYTIVMLFGIRLIGYRSFFDDTLLFYVIYQVLSTFFLFFLTFYGILKKDKRSSYAHILDFGEGLSMGVGPATSN